ncbi:MAG: hypothetical protein ACLSTI_11580, partial [Ruminococcus sp.]
LSTVVTNRSQNFGRNFHNLPDLWTVFLRDPSILMVFAEGNLLRIPRLAYRKGRVRELLQQEKNGS